MDDWTAPHPAATTVKGPAPKHPRALTAHLHRAAHSWMTFIGSAMQRRGWFRHDCSLAASSSGPSKLPLLRPERGKCRDRLVAAPLAREQFAPGLGAGFGELPGDRRV